MKNPLFYLLIMLYALTACSNGEDYREPKSEEDLSGLVLAASNGSYYQQKYEKRADVRLLLRLYPRHLRHRRHTPRRTPSSVSTI